MKKTYSKPELYTIEYSTNTAFCGACEDKENELKQLIFGPNSFAIDDACGDKVEDYCKFTYAGKIMNS